MIYRGSLDIILGAKRYVGIGLELYYRLMLCRGRFNAILQTMLNYNKRSPDDDE